MLMFSPIIRFIKSKNFTPTVLRVLFCWTLGFFVLQNDEVNSFDLRLKVREAQPTDSRIIIVDMTKKNWDNIVAKSFFSPLPYRLFNQPINENYFWNSQIWFDLLTLISKAEPLSIGVNLFFDSEAYTPVNYLNQLKKMDVTWISGPSRYGKIQLPKFSYNYSVNVGLNDLSPDSDGVVRSFKSSWAPIPQFSTHLLKKVAKLKIPEKASLINFRNEYYNRIQFSDVLLKKVSPDIFKDKIVIIGSAEPENTEYLTPVGPLSRSEIHANILDNLLNELWIHKYPQFYYGLFLLFLILLGMGILYRFPVSFSLISLIGISFGLVALSLYLFDIYRVWLPIFSSLVTLWLTYLTFISKLLTDKEYKNWRLKQEGQNERELSQLKHNFVSLISHDLKNPLAKIQALSDKLQRHKLAPDFSADIDSIKNETTHLNRYIQSILKFSRLESEDFKLRLEPVDINKLVTSVLEQLKKELKAKKIKLNTNFEPLFSIEADSVLVREIIFNLVENAIKYGHHGMDLVVSTSEIEDSILVKIKDKGPGISDGDQKKIFDKFYRTSPFEDSLGSGLGLYLVKYFIELHGGRIELKSEIDQGSEFFVYLPSEFKGALIK